MKVLEVNKEDLKNNINIIKQIASTNSENSPTPEIIAVVKANRSGVRFNSIF